MEMNGHTSEKQQRLVSIDNDNQCHETEIQDEHVNNLFRKRFLIADNESYVLPDSKSLFKSYPWKIDALQTLKNELNNVKDLLNNYGVEWQYHTTMRNSARNVMIKVKQDIQPEFMTQAWCKFYEIVSSFPLVSIEVIRNSNNHFKSVHLCEAPGAFITSLNHWLNTNVPDIQWKWIATTLNPYYENNSPSIMIDDDRFIRYTSDNWCFGEDNTGNLINLKNLDALVKFAEPHNEIFLVTADGSIDCTNNPAEQENIVVHLHFCETVTALNLLNTGGSFLLKVFTVFEHDSVCLIYLLSCCFGQVSMVKPATSKEGNSEAYIVCTNFKGPTFIKPYLEECRKHYECNGGRAMFYKDDIPSSFLEKIVKCSEFFKSQQCLAIMKNIHSFESDNNSMYGDIKQMQCMVADKYIKDCNLKKLISGEIVGKMKLERSNKSNMCKRLIQESYNERCKKRNLTSAEQLRKLFSDCNKIKFSISTDDSTEFKFHKIPEDLRIRTGKIFHKIHSSRFCATNILKIRSDCENIVLNAKCKIQFPSEENIAKLHNEVLAKPGHKLLIFKYTDVYDSHEIIVTIHNALQSLETGESLILVGYPLLTLLSVGLLCLISCAFSSKNVELSDNVGSKITLNDYQYKLKILKYLIDIRMASSNAKEAGKAIIEVIPAILLYEYNIFSTSVDINHWTIKSFVRCVSSIIGEDTSSEESHV